MPEKITRIIIRRLFTYHFSISILLLFIAVTGYGQATVSGVVYDSSKTYVVPHVQVFTTSGNQTVTDSLGAYHIATSKDDSVSFFYAGKFTHKFPVATMANASSFDISLHVKVQEKYKLLKGVTVFSDTYKMDSIENRQVFANVFGSEKPAIRSNYTPGGAAGLDLSELIGMFQFKKNKRQQAFQQRLLDQEQERYIDYRFSAQTIARITGLQGEMLEKYRKEYRPSYFFVSNSTVAQFYEFILNTSYIFKAENRIKQ